MQANGTVEDGAVSERPTIVAYHRQFRRGLGYLENLSLTPTVTNPLSERQSTFGKFKENAVLEETPANSQREEYEFVDPLGATVEDSVTPPPLIISHSKWIEPEEDKALKRKSQTEDTILDNTLEMKPSDNLAIDVEFLDFEPWRKKREKILKTFTTTEKLELSSSFLPTKPVNLRMLDKTKHRLEVLEDMSGLRKLSELSQQEFVNHVNELRELLLIAWSNNKRVEALRLVIELSRMLSQTNTPFFYPSQWVLVIDIIDLFGLLVYKRLLAKTNEERKAMKQSPLGANFTSDDIPTNTVDVARNWFCKIADIKELIPRFYIETSLLACFRFLDSPAIRVNLMRLATMCSKFQHGLCAAYARAYLCKTAMHLDAADRGPHWKCLNDWLQGSANLSSINLTWPALEWVIQCVSYSANSRDDIAPLWEYCRSEQHRDYLLRAFLSAVSAKYLNSYANEALDLVLQLANPTEELITLGKQLLRAETPTDERVKLAKRAWESIAKLPDVTSYLRCAAPWCEFASKYFDIEMLISIIKNIAKRLAPVKDHSPFLENMVQIVRGVVEPRKSEDLINLIKSNSFMTFIDWIRDEPYSSESAQILLKSLVKTCSPSNITNTIIAEIIVDQCSKISSSLKPDSLDDEIRNYCNLACTVLDLVDFRHPELGINWLVSVRAALCEQDQVVRHVVSMMITLGMHSVVTMKESKKKANFLRVIVASIFVTIPSIDDVNQQLEFTLQTIEIALLANSLPQADSLLRFYLQKLDAIAWNSEDFSRHVEKFLAILIFMPDAPNKPILLLFDALIRIIEKREVTHNDIANFYTGLTLMHCLRYLSAAAQSELPRRFGSLESNDIVYGGSEEFQSAISSRTEIMFVKLSDCLNCDSSTEPKLSLVFVEHILFYMNLDVIPKRAFMNSLKRCLHASTCYVEKLKSIYEDLKTSDEFSQAADFMNEFFKKYNII